MSIRLLSTNDVPLTLELAKKFCTMSPLVGERPKKPIRLKHFQDHIKAGSFGEPIWSVAVLKGGGQEYRADGQHTSTVLAELAPNKFPEDLKVTIRRFEIDSVEEDAGALFERFDSPGSARTNTDVMGIHRAEHEDLSALALAFLVQVASGIDFYLKSLPVAEGATPARRWECRKHGFYYNEIENRNFALWLHQWDGTKHFDFVGRSGVMAEALADWKASPGLATEFWSYVFKENHPDPNHETRELVSTIKEMAGKPKFKQSDYRSRSKKYWSRFRRLAEAEQRKAASEDLLPLGQVTGGQSEMRA
jgi:hypothetical protein